MSPKSPGNTQLKAARQHAGYSSQQTFADALTAAAPRLGLGGLAVSVRQVRRWESDDPPWPRPDYQTLIVHILQMPIGNLGFSAPWEGGGAAQSADADRQLAGTAPPMGLAATQPAASVQPQTIGADFGMITGAHRRMYWTVQPSQLHPAVVEHAQLGFQLLAETTGLARRLLATALAESLLLAGRIEFFDLRKPDEANGTFARALQAAGDAGNSLLGAAILAHAAFIPGWEQRRADAAERLRAARTYARRADAPNEFLAWIHAVEAECDTISGHPKDALNSISRAEKLLVADSEARLPEWFTWFSPARLAAFKGNVQLKANRPAQAFDTLLAALDGLSENDGKQRSVILADIAAVEAFRKKPAAACSHIHEALDLLTTTWYGVGMERIKAVREHLEPWAETKAVRAVDDRLYSWQTTLNTFQH